MEILLFGDFISHLASQKSSDFKADINKIFSNENSRFRYSKKFISFVKADLPEENLDVFNSIVTKLGDTGVNVPSSHSSESIEEEIIHLNSIECGDNLLLKISYDDPNSSISSAISGIAVVSKQKKPNYHWLVCQIAILHPHKVSLNYWDFSDNTQIRQLFRDVFSLPKDIKEVTIFDRQCNLFHDKYDFLPNGAKVFYYTKDGYRYSCPTANNDNYQTIKNKFGNRIKMFTANNKFVHGRRLVFNSIVLIADNDFQNLVVNEADWVIDIQVSQTNANKSMERRSIYKEFIPRFIR